MFLERVKSNGTYYLYLKNYSTRLDYSSKKETIFKFGKIDIAIHNMKRWRSNYSEFPFPLIELGCDKEDLEGWIKTLETGRHKTGRTFKAVI